MEQNKLGINLRALLDAQISMALRHLDLSNYEQRNNFIDYIEERIMECYCIIMSNGTTYEKNFTPNGSTLGVRAGNQRKKIV